MNALVSAWLIERVKIAELATRDAAVVVEPHAELIEENPARWHWRHLLERVADDDDVLAKTRPLVELLAAGPAATAFYSYSSLIRLCFSSSSHYPWVDEGLPVVTPMREGHYLVEGNRRGGEAQVGTYALDEAAAQVERLLAAAPVPPFFGSWPHHAKTLADAALAALGSPLRSELWQREAWYRLRIFAADRQRSCRVDGDAVWFFAGDAESRTPYRAASFDEAVRTANLYCLGSATVEEVVAELKLEKI